jgi:hypothetical protein
METIVEHLVSGCTADLYLNMLRWHTVVQERWKNCDYRSSGVLRWHTVVQYLIFLFSTYLEADWVGWPDKRRSTTSLLIFYIGVYEFLRHLVRNKLFHAKYWSWIFDNLYYCWWTSLTMQYSKKILLLHHLPFI